MNLFFVLGVVVVALTLIPVVTQIRHHPKGLLVLFFAEMWERFSYYGMRSLLIFYLTQHFLFNDGEASVQYGAYTSLVYLLPLLGGVIADNFLGTRRAVAFGALLLVLGHSTMALEGKAAIQTLDHASGRYEFNPVGRGNDRMVFLKVGEENYSWSVDREGTMRVDGLPEASPLPSLIPADSYSLGKLEKTPYNKHVLFLALALITLGVGYLKGNISSIVGQLYKEGDKRKDSGYTLYYYGINLGSLLSTLACGYLGQTVGWWAGFGLAAIGMAAGFIVFVRGKSWLQGVGEPPRPEIFTKKREYGVYAASLLVLIPAYFIMTTPAVNKFVLAFFTILILAYIFFHMLKMSIEQRHQLSLALILVAVSVVFWMLFEQAASSLNHFADRNTQLPNAPLFTITASMTQSFNAGFILIFAPIFSFMWARLARIKRDPSIPMKFGLALIQVGLGFMVLVFGSQFADESFRVPLLFLVFAYLLHTTGELCLSPIGLSMVSKLSPKIVLSTMMAIWFLSSAWAQEIAGHIARLTASETVAGQVIDPGGALATYVHVFRNIGFLGIGVGILCMLASGYLKKLAHNKLD